MVSEICDLPIANASLLDEGTAASEAMLMLYRKNKGMDLLYRINYQPLAIMLGLNLVMGQMIEQIDNWGHIGGLITGSIIGLIYSYMIGKRFK